MTTTKKTMIKKSDIGSKFLVENITTTKVGAVTRYQIECRVIDSEVLARRLGVDDRRREAHTRRKKHSVIRRKSAEEFREERRIRNGGGLVTLANQLQSLSLKGLS